VGESFFRDACSEVCDLTGWYCTHIYEFLFDYVMRDCWAHSRYYYYFVGIEIFSYFDWNVVVSVCFGWLSTFSTSSTLDRNMPKWYLDILEIKIIFSGFVISAIAKT